MKPTNKTTSMQNDNKENNKQAPRSKRKNKQDQEAK
jgi:hypothetical protein